MLHFARTLAFYFANTVLASLLLLTTSVHGSNQQRLQQPMDPNSAFSLVMADKLNQNQKQKDK